METFHISFHPIGINLANDGIPREVRRFRKNIMGISASPHALAGRLSTDNYEYARRILETNEYIRRMWQLHSQSAPSNIIPHPVRCDTR